MSSGELPPCCETCRALDAGTRACSLLSQPTFEHRRQLLTMPCQVERLLERRFRAQGEDVARDALVAWLRPEWAPGDVVQSFGRAPRDARLWLTAWPYLYLGRTSVRRQQRERPAEPPSDWQDVAAPSDPALPGRVVRALERVRRIDPVDYALLLDVLRDRFDGQAWASALGISAATVTDRKHLALYRYWMAFHDVLERVLPHEAAVALATRRLSPGDPTDASSLEATRRSLKHAGALSGRRAESMSLSEWRELYREGASSSLRILAEPDALGPELLGELQTALRRVLRLA